MKSIWLLALAVCACAPDAAFHCASSEQCRDGASTGTCEATGFCSFPDGSCPSGARYTTAAGSLSEACVPGFSMGTDSDGDGVVDAMDNCPMTPNPDQGNEDGDKYGDACDPCPPYADDVFTDTDGDGIDDHCDPHVGQTDHIVMFEGFHHGVPAAWTIDGGTWVADGDSIVGNPSTMGGPPGTVFFTMPYTATKSVQISAGLRPTEIEAVTSSAGVVGAFDGTHVLACALRQANSQTFIAEDTGGGTTNSKPWAFVVDTQYTVALTFDLQHSLGCYVENGGANTTASVNVLLPPAETERAFGIYLDRMPMRVDWIMMIEQN